MFYGCCLRTTEDRRPFIQRYKDCTVLLDIKKRREPEENFFLPPIL
jgi:hypothetical protein